MTTGRINQITTLRPRGGDIAIHRRPGTRPPEGDRKVSYVIWKGRTKRPIDREGPQRTGDPRRPSNCPHWALQDRSARR